ncbi:hypothetical protein MTP99_017465 [Tenebrio molitor]|nr:hypothetical protein MTP99_017465 [Tenebrio molitor]
MGPRTDVAANVKTLHAAHHRLSWTGRTCTRQWRTVRPPFVPPPKRISTKNSNYSEAQTGDATLPLLFIVLGQVASRQ